MRIVPIDPALRSSGLARLDDDVLREAVTVKCPARFKGNDAVVEMGTRLLAAMRALVHPSGEDVRFVVEDPFQSHIGGHSGGYRAGATGRWTGAVFGAVIVLIATQFPTSTCRISPVREWKGSYGFLPAKNRGADQIAGLEVAYADVAFPGFEFKSHDERVAALLGLWSVTSSRWGSS